MPTEHAPIYESLHEASEPYALSPHWAGLTVQQDCRQLNGAPGVFQELAARFPAADLRAAGVAQQVGSELALNPLLVADDPGFIVLRNRDGVAFDIATSRGCLYGGAPALRMHHDRTTQHDLGQQSPHAAMYATFCMADAVLLRSLRVPVTLATGLADLTFAGLQRLLRLVGGTASGDIPKMTVELGTDEPEDLFDNCIVDNLGPSEDEGRCFQLTLLAGSMTELTADVPGALRRVARHLADAEKYLGFQWMGIDVWHPTPAELATLRYRYRVQSPHGLRRFLLSCRARHQLDAFRRAGPPKTSIYSPAAHYIELLNKQQPRPRGALDFGPPKGNPEEERRSYEQFVDQHFVEPFLDVAMSSTKPEDRELYADMAVTARLYHRVVPALFEIESRSAEEIRRNEGQILPPEAFKQWHGLAEHLLKLAHQHAAIKKGQWGR